MAATKERDTSARCTEGRRRPRPARPPRSPVTPSLSRADAEETANAHRDADRQRRRGRLAQRARAAETGAIRAADGLRAKRSGRSSARCCSGSIAAVDRRGARACRTSARAGATELVPAPPPVVTAAASAAARPTRSAVAPVAASAPRTSPKYSTRPTARRHNERLTMKRVVGRELLTTILREAAPADLRIVGRMLFHAAIVGVAAGLMGAAFFAALEVVQRLILEDLGGYRPLRAHGETFLPEIGEPGPFPAVAAGASARGRRARERHHLGAGARDARRRRRRDDQRLPPPGRRRAQARGVGEGAGVDLHARDGRLGRPRGADDADRRRARLDLRRGCCASTPASGGS